MQGDQGWFLVGMIPWRKGIFTHSSSLALENSTNRGIWQAMIHRIRRVGQHWATLPLVFQQQSTEKLLKTRLWLWLISNCRVISFPSLTRFFLICFIILSILPFYSLSEHCTSTAAQALHCTSLTSQEIPRCKGSVFPFSATLAASQDSGSHCENKCCSFRTG